MTQSIKPMNCGKWRLFILVLTLCVFGNLVSAAPQQLNQEPEKQRDIVNNQFKSKRPPDKNQPQPRKPKKAAPNDLIGLTIWSLRPAPPTEKNTDRPRLLVQHNNKGAAQEFKAVRETTEKVFSKDEPVRLSIEVPEAKNQYLYVIDREMYSNGTFSEPFLIFPTLGTRKGNNLVTAGKLIDIPAATDDPPFFSFKDMAANVIGERLTIIVSPQPLPVPPLERGPVKLNNDLVGNWEREWGGDTQKWEDSKMAGQEWTKQEKASASDSKRLLTQKDPAPQTIFQVKGKTTNGPLLVVMKLLVK